MTVGKLYGGILIHENWRNTKFGSIEELRRQEAELEELERAEALAAAEDAAKEVADRGKQKKLIQCNTIVVDFPTFHFPRGKKCKKMKMKYLTILEKSAYRIFPVLFPTSRGMHEGILTSVVLIPQKKIIM